MSWGWSSDETGMRDEEWDAREDEAQDALEQAMQDCGRTDEPGRCDLMGTTQCEVLCPFRDRLSQH